MSDYGSIIAKLRKEHNMTQAELGDALNVTFQAVSKWERNLSQPDLGTVMAMVNLFGVSLDIFNEDAVTDEDEYEEEEYEEEYEEEEVHEDTYTCLKCGKNCKKSEIANFDDGAICESCNNRLIKARKVAIEKREMAERQEADRKLYLQKLQKRDMRKKFWIALIVGCSIILLWGILSVSSLYKSGYRGFAVFGALYPAVFLGALVAQMCYHGWLRNLVSEGFSKVVSMPGVIFAFSLESILFMLIYKIVAPIIGVLIGLVIGFVVLTVAIIIAPFTAIPSMISLYRNGET